MKASKAVTQNLRQKTAFTLVELLVVISIIALLLAILMPTLSAAREQGRSIVCSQRLRQQHLAHVLYAQENKDTFFQSWLWFREMIAYKKQKGDITLELIKCPTSVNMGVAAKKNRFLGGWRSGAATMDPPFVEGGHAFNSLMNGIGGGGIGATKISRHRFPSKTAVAIDSWNPYWRVLSGMANDDATFRHRKRGSANIVWLDGHTASEKKGRRFYATDLYYNWPND